MTVESWKISNAGKHYLDLEFDALQEHIRSLSGSSMLVVGRCFSAQMGTELDQPNAVHVYENCKGAKSAQTNRLLATADAAFLPFIDGAFSAAILPHVLEGHELQYQVLREAHRVLQPEGVLILTGFNPYSFAGLQRLARSKSAFPGEYYSVGRVRDWLQLLGFEVHEQSMFHYSPLLQNQRLQRGLGAINILSDRWLPMFSGGYMISARKKVGGTRFVGRVAFENPKRTAAGAVPARKVIQD